ncbi:MAG: DUF2914 domain-containing protein [Elusimicrobiota bacterium]|jgi:hypothetical protein
MTKGIFIGLCMAALIGQARAQQDAGKAEPQVAVVRNAVCTAVRDREPVLPVSGAADFKAGRLYFWTELRTTPPASVKHRWSREGRQVFEIVLSAKHARTRTWSSVEAIPGSWKVEILSGTGEVLKSAEFKVVP